MAPASLAVVRSMLQQQQEVLLKRLDWQDESLDQILKNGRSQCQYENNPTRSDSWLASIDEDADINDDILDDHQRQVSSIADMMIPWRSFSRHSLRSPSPDVSTKPSIFRSNTEEEQIIREAATRREVTFEDDEGRHGLHRITTEERYEALTCREKLKIVVTGAKFEIGIGFLVMTNAMFIGAEVEHEVYNTGQNPIVFRVLGHIYTTLFLVELLLRLTAWGKEFFYTGAWTWNLLDLFIVLSSLWDSAVEVMFAASSEHNLDGGVSLSPLRVVRIVRITRLVRVTKIARILRFIKALRTLVMSIIATLKSLFWAGVLMLLIMYAFSIVFAQAASNFEADMAVTGDTSTVDDLRRYWKGLPKSMLTLFMSISGGVSWNEVLRPLEECGSFYLFLFLFYISFAYFAVLNVVTGVFCQSAIESAQSDHDMIMSSIIANKDAHVAKVRSLFKDLDADNSGFISLVELEQNITKPSVQTYFEALELNVRDAWNFFKLLDADGGNAIEIDEFLMGCLRLRGPARALDLAKLQHDHAWMMKQIGQFAKYVEVGLKKLEKHINVVKADQSALVHETRAMHPPRKSYRQHSLNKHHNNGTAEADRLAEPFDTPETDCNDMEIRASPSSTFFASK
eukprot:TRINITY_DN59855_c0_g1_i1.p1 TRINITY_DN59855_c0_g1~~TRINITY_DN59855_c0_g1_i1.p1  ORF type:complete len:646 (-),score=99.99 TRINITY_DN59855_c0_g1_i1:112-1989(-)